MAKIEGKHGFDPTARDSLRRKVLPWMGLVAVALIGFAATMVYLERGGSAQVTPLSASGGAIQSPSSDAVQSASGVAGGHASEGLGSRLVRAFRGWLPRLGASLESAEEALFGRSNRSGSARTHGSGAWSSLNSVGNTFGARPDGQPGSDLSAAGNGIAVATAGSSALAGAASAPRTPVQREKIDGGLSAYPGGGVEVDEVLPGSVAGKLGLRSGDVVLSVNGNAISSPEEFAQIFHEQGLPRQVEIVRDGRVLHRH